MSTSKAITRNDLTSILNDVLPAGSGGGIVNVDDMTSVEVEEFVEDLTPTTSENISAAIADYFTPTAWTNLTLNSQATSAGLNAWRMIGPFVELHLCFTTSAAHTSWTEISSMPVGKRPHNGIRILSQGPATITMLCNVDYSGSIKLYNNSTTGITFEGNIIYYPDN